MTNAEVWRELCSALGRSEELPEEALNTGVEWFLSESSLALPAGHLAVEGGTSVSLSATWLNRAFSWSHTPEGNHFWFDLDSSIHRAMGGGVADIQVAVREWRVGRI